MYRHLQNQINKPVNAQLTIKEDMKRGTFVKTAFDTTDKVSKIEKATTIAEVEGILVRDVVVDVDVAMGLPISDYSETQDLVKAKEYAGVEPIYKGERLATDQYGTLTDTEAQEGKYLTVTAGKLEKSADATTIVSLGWIMDAGHKLLGFKFI
ncbi:UNVERIFIED_ORG: hypothetical protein B2H93_13485 [Clostridium botulinum]